MLEHVRVTAGGNHSQPGILHGGSVVEGGANRTGVEAEPNVDIRRRVDGEGLVAKQVENTPTQVDYIACDVPDDMTLAQFRRGMCQERRRFPRLRELGMRWLRRPPRD
jgi:hypothetical protein